MSARTERAPSLFQVLSRMEMKSFYWAAFGWNHTIKFLAQFSCINRVKARASLRFTIADTCQQFYFTAV